jgi:hypothetical protein
MRVVSFGAVAAVVVLSTACSSSGGDQPPRSFGQAPSTVTIEVNNRNFARATLHWVTGGTRRRLGAVEGLNEVTFTIDRFSVSQPVQIEINQTAGQRCTTRQIIVDPGDVLYLEIRVNFRDTPNCF